MRVVALERSGTKFNRPNEKGLPNQGRNLSDPFEEVEIDPSCILKQSKLKVPLGRKEVVSESIDVILPRGSGHISLVKSSDQVTGGMPKEVSGELGLDQNVGQKMKGVDGVEVGIDISLRSPHTQGMALLSYGFIDNKCGKRKLVVSHKKLIDAKRKKWYIPNGDIEDNGDCEKGRDDGEGGGAHGEKYIKINQYKNKKEVVRERKRERQKETEDKENENKPEEKDDEDDN
ncbi:hypothetical protein Q3G72_019341 [Acer saccharum]|nr:hypothetical protein Q3G72_019341 [Acer saccharum]